MDGDPRAAALDALSAVLDWLMPMHLMLDADARVLGHGRTAGRLFGGRSVLGESFIDMFDLRSPRSLTCAEDLAAVAGQSLRLSLRGGAFGHLRLRGVLLPYAGRDAASDGGRNGGSSGGSSGAQGWIVNLSFGIDLPRAVTQLQLTDADFAPTDLAMELLYLVEANLAVTGELGALAGRLEGARSQAREEAETDTLTGLRNRRACDSVLARLCREGDGFAALHLDLDFFKAVNDTLGHAAGDHVLVHVAGVMASSSRGGDCLARVGGDEFVMLLPGAVDPAVVQGVAERMIAALEHPIPFGDSFCRISASIGFTLVRAGEVVDPAQVMAEADAALYAAKNAGRGRAMQAA
jgi:diguanylate cyclase (GGDEF)-like protein